MSTKNFSILLVIDGSESSIKAVDYAIELAKKQDNSRLTVLNIIDIDTPKQVSSSIITAPTYGLEEYQLIRKLFWSGWMRLRGNVRTRLFKQK